MARPHDADMVNLTRQGFIMGKFAKVAPHAVANENLTSSAATLNEALEQTASATMAAQIAALTDRPPLPQITTQIPARAKLAVSRWGLPGISSLPPR